MPFVKRNEDGGITGQFANRQLGYAEEWVEDDSPELSQVGLAQLAIAERVWRNAELAKLAWLRDRHRDQQEIGGETSLTTERFSELLVFMQQLRDWPQSNAFPDSSARPLPPVFLEKMRIEQ
ncbi:phage tail assembly chaperone [Pseudomonas sichuanensis]|uniref:phage tail assembly chaperone n=1 Tax=Pseudomonas sichuanensis TaxID=2213015 RepID=UPI000DA6A062|nr:phage tail assembly chaperone [Pseudomonas sichuanensis]